jgi:hypothetical protein
MQMGNMSMIPSESHVLNMDNIARESAASMNLLFFRTPQVSTQRRGEKSEVPQEPLNPKVAATSRSHALVAGREGQLEKARVGKSEFVLSIALQ